MSIRDLITFPANKKSEYDTNCDIAKSLLENYGNINKEDKESCTLLTRDLITFPANKKSEYDTKTDLMVAIELSALGTNCDIAKSLLENYGNINKEDSTSEESRTLLTKTLLMDSEYMNTEIIKYIIEKGASVNKLPNPFKKNNIKMGSDFSEELMEYVNECVDKRYGKYIPIRLAAIKKYGDIVKLMLEKGCDINESNNECDTMLVIAVRNNQLELVKLALEYKANVNTDYPPLFVAIYYGFIECAKLLLNAGANINPNKYEYLFEKAIEMDMNISDNYETTRLFFEKGASIHMLPEKGIKILKTAIAKNNHGMVELLLDNGVDINQEKEYPYLTLFVQTLGKSDKDSHEKIIRIMLKHNVKYDLTVALNWTNKNNIIIRNLLEETNVELLISAIKLKNINMVKVLIKKEKYSEETFIKIIKCNNLELIKCYFENIKPKTSLNNILGKIMNETIDYDILNFISENLK